MKEQTRQQIKEWLKTTTMYPHDQKFVTALALILTVLLEEDEQ